MLIKRLELQGFKSFARRTAFDFDGGITAIVGPNGSGKSNIADAIRWVTGEQSNRLLRTKKLEEVIFAGSSQRTGVGMAEVSLFLDNTDGILPIDFSEVSITRRAFRSGESEYFINRSRARLRDVVDLLLRGNVAHNGYTVLGQGLVDTVLNLRPDERRSLIEEAAGVKVHRLRMEESQDKLKATRDNLERVGYIVAEITPRLSKLEQQSRRAREEARIRRSFLRALIAWYRLQWTQAQRERQAATDSAERSRAKLEETAAELTAVQRDINALRDIVEAGRREAEVARRRREERARALQQAQQELRFSEQRQQMASRQHSELAEEVQSLEVEVASLKEHLAAAQREEQEVAARLQAQESAAAALDEERRRIEVQGQQARSALNAARQAADVSVKALAQVESQIAQVESRLPRIKEETAKGRERLRGLIEGYLKAREAARDLRQQAAVHAEHLAAITSQKDDLLREVEQAQGDLRSLEVELQRARQEKDLAQQRLGFLSAADRQSHFGEGVRAVLDRSSQGGRQIEERQRIIVYRGESRGVIGRLLSLFRRKEAPPPLPTVTEAMTTLVSIISAPKEMEAAIEAALEGFLQSLVVPRQKDAMAAIEYLVQTRKGRATFLPLDGLREIAPINVMKEPGVIGVASKLVHCAPQHRRLIDVLLGRTIIVEDLDTARHVVRRGTGNVVTRRGEILMPNGAVIGGHRAADGGMSVLQLESQARELPERVTSLESTIAQVAEREDRQRARLQELQTYLERLNRAEKDAGQAAAEHQQVLAAQMQQADRARHEIKWLAKSMRGLRRERAELERALKAHEARRLDAASKEASSREALNALTERMQAGETSNNGPFATRYAEAKAAVAGSQRERQNVRNALSNYSASLNRLERQLEARRARLAQVTREDAQSHTALTQARAHYEDLRSRQESEDAANVSVPAGQLTEKERELQRKRMQEEDIRRQRADIERQLTRAEDAAQRGSEAISHLQAMAEAEGLTIDDEGQVTAPGDFDVDTEGGVEQALPQETAQLKKTVETLRARLRNLGPVSREAVQEYEDLKERHTYLKQQMDDLRLAEENLQRATQDLEGMMKERFERTFKAVACEFETYFSSFFGGGKAKLLLNDAQEAEPGIDIVAQPPGKRLQSLNLLSGGERALTATALLFSLLRINPPPFCVLDEVDASLDDANVVRLVQTLRQLADRTHFILITHNHATVEAADNIYGVSMDGDKISRVLSLRLNGACAG